MTKSKSIKYMLGALCLTGGFVTGICLGIDSSKPVVSEIVDAENNNQVTLFKQDIPGSTYKGIKRFKDKETGVSCYYINYESISCVRN